MKLNYRICKDCKHLVWQRCTSSPTDDIRSVPERLECGKMFTIDHGWHCLSKRKLFSLEVKSSDIKNLEGYNVTPSCCVMIEVYRVFESLRTL